MFVFFCGQNFKANDELLFFSFFSFAPSVPPFPPPLVSLVVSKVEGGSKRVVSSGRVVGFTRVVIASLCYEKSDERVLFSKRVCARVLSVTILLLLCDGAHLPPASSSPMMTLSSRRRTKTKRALLLQRQAMHGVLVFERLSFFVNGTLKTKKEF